MKVKINFGEEIQVPLQMHLDEGVAIAAYVRAAVKYFNKMRNEEIIGKQVGSGDKNRFSTYNTIISANLMLDAEVENWDAQR